MVKWCEEEWRLLEYATAERSVLEAARPGRTLEADTCRYLSMYSVTTFVTLFNYQL